jgi:hypothetical protein
LCEGDKPYFALLKTVRSAEDKYLITVFGLQVMQFNVTAPETGRRFASETNSRWMSSWILFQNHQILEHAFCPSANA